METMETKSVSTVSEEGGQRAEAIVEAAGRLFFAPGFARVSMDDLARELGMSKKSIYRHFPDRRGLLTAVLDRQFTAVERTLAAAAEDAEGEPFDVRVQRFLIAAGTELGRIGAAQLATGRGGDAMLRQYVEQRVDAVIYQRIDELFRDGHRRGLLLAPPELLGEITRGALERLFLSRLPHELEWTAADLLRATVDTVLYGAIRPTRARSDGERLATATSAARDDEEEVSP
ncbi:TetR/AcrR family transcriptional regulator [Streptomyces sp. NPDC021562]|uniref:TetR/AcrR family transcriptional regulator n=1 Tax=Streptomyces sp. NPDC021562 TaxID=3155121 RepID=UPI0033CA902B